MAAGLGSRYGGLKQLDRVGPDRETLIDYAVFDARRAGFTRVVFVIREELADAFASFIRRFSTGLDVSCVDELRAVIGGVFERYAACAIAVKTQHAYFRTLAWTERSDDEASRALAVV